MKKYIYPIIIILLLIILSVQTFTKPDEIKIDDRQIENRIREKTIYTYKDSIIYIDSVILTYKTIRNTIRENNANTLDSFYNDQTGTETMNRTECDTIIQGLVTEIVISDTIIDNLTDKTILQDTVINSLEIINETNRIYIEDVEDKLIKSENKIKRKNIWIIISTSVAAILTIILIAN